MESIDVEKSVQDRYSAAAQSLEPALCCPIVNYDRKLLEVIPKEVIERDYGCGDPSKFVKKGDVVLDLGSGGGKVCFLAAQMVGPEGKVIGVDRNRDMLKLANSAAPKVAEAIGYSNVEFRVGNIQNLALDLQKLGEHLQAHPVKSREDYIALMDLQKKMMRETPLIEDESIDIVLSNCVLNLVNQEDRLQMFKELYRVVKRGGRVAISDIVCDEDVPQELMNDEKLWSGCISGAFREDKFVQAFADAGFYGVHLVKRDAKPWQVVNGIEFRAVTVVAYKGKEGPCKEGFHAVVYPGPWSEVKDDDGHVYKRGERVATCIKTYNILMKEPYAEHIIGLPPVSEVREEDAKPFACKGYSIRPVSETKNGQADESTRSEQSGCCPTDGSCC